MSHMEYKALLFERKNLSHIFLPISSRHLLSGTLAGEEGKQPLAEIINTASATLSRSFFVSKQKTDIEMKLSTHIGSQASALTKEQEMEAVGILRKQFFGE